jgi:hypothetical protein
MPDCPQITKEKRVKLGSSIDCTQKQQSLNISEMDSISEKKGFILQTFPISLRGPKAIKTH